MSKKGKGIFFIVFAIISIIFVIYLLPSKLTNYSKYDDFIELDITNGNTGESIVVPKEDSLDLLKKMNSTKTKKDGMALGSMGYTYRVNIVGGCSYDSFIINSNDCARKTIFFYSMDSTLKDDIDALFKSNKYTYKEDIMFSATIKEVLDDGIRVSSEEEKYNNMKVIIDVSAFDRSLKIGDKVDIYYQDEIKNNTIIATDMGILEE